MRNATRVTVSTFGALAGLVGIEHGIGEILQGSKPPAGLVIESWPDSAFFSIQGGEPAMTIVPNLLVSGLLTCLVSLIFILWAVKFVHRKHGGLVLFLLAIVMLLVGGGFGPPLLGFIVSAAASQIHAPQWGHSAGRWVNAMRSFGKLWPWFYGLSLAAWLALFPGTNLLSYFFGVEDENLLMGVIATAFGSLLLTILTGMARDRSGEVVGSSIAGSGAPAFPASR